MITISRVYLLLIIALPSCSSISGDNYKDLEDKHPKSSTRNFYIFKATKAVSESSLNPQLKTYGVPHVLKRTGFKQFLVKDQIKVRWVKSKDSLATSGRINPITIETISVTMNKPGEVINLDHSQTKGDASFSQPSIAEYLSKFDKSK